MSESKHTPGPWTHRPDYVKDSALNGWCVREADGSGVTGWGCVTQTEANARLIAAAPELLAASKAFLDYYTSGKIEQFTKVYNAIRDAVNKAEGTP